MVATRSATYVPVAASSPSATGSPAPYCPSTPGTGRYSRRARSLTISSETPLPPRSSSGQRSLQTSSGQRSRLSSPPVLPSAHGDQGYSISSSESPVGSPSPPPAVLHARSYASILQSSPDPPSCREPAAIRDLRLCRLVKDIQDVCRTTPRLVSRSRTASRSTTTSDSSVTVSLPRLQAPPALSRLRNERIGNLIYSIKVIIRFISRLPLSIPKPIAPLASRLSPPVPLSQRIGQPSRTIRQRVNNLFSRSLSLNQTAAKNQIPLIDRIRPSDVIPFRPTWPNNISIQY